uniref:Ig-like domain-containing protein n=1 Tax=Cyprinodon variegatus TaxID=28743 RepID=A0A3Q2D5Q9_CYPVA
MSFFAVSVLLFCFIDTMASPPVIQQAPAFIQVKSGEEARLECYHGDNSYPYMLWYQSTVGGRKTMDLIGLLHYENKNPEKGFESRFNLTGHSKGKAWLVISDTKPADTAQYFCAASQHSALIPVAAAQKHFCSYLACTCKN